MLAGTIDIDVNVFVPATNAERVLRALPEGIARPDGTEEKIARDGQIRLWWDEVPVDLFFDYVPIHGDAARNRRSDARRSTERWCEHSWNCR